MVHKLLIAAANPAGCVLQERLADIIELRRSGANLSGHSPARRAIALASKLLDCVCDQPPASQVQSVHRACGIGCLTLLARIAPYICNRA